MIDFDDEDDEFDDEFNSIESWKIIIQKIQDGDEE
jgi:hypothetical protein